MDEEYEVKLNTLKNKLLKYIELVKNKNIPKPYRLSKAVVITDINIELEKIRLAVITTSSLKVLDVFKTRLESYLKIEVLLH